MIPRFLIVLKPKCARGLFVGASDSGSAASTPSAAVGASTDAILEPIQQPLRPATSLSLAVDSVPGKAGGTGPLGVSPVSAGRPMLGRRSALPYSRPSAMPPSLSRASCPAVSIGSKTSSPREKPSPHGSLLATPRPHLQRASLTPQRAPSPLLAQKPCIATRNLAHPAHLTCGRFIEWLACSCRFAQAPGTFGAA
jgi:hypothetical protein